MEKTTFDRLEERLSNEQFNGEKIRWTSLGSWHISGRVSNSPAFDDFTRVAVNRNIMYIRKGNIIYAQPHNYQPPYCFGCNSQLMFKQAKVTQVCAEGELKSKTEIPYCPTCEEEPEPHLFKWG